MIKKTILAVGIGVAASASSAGCADGILSLERWQIEPIDDETNLLTTEFKFIGPRPIRLLDAVARFKDVLGENIGAFTLDRDVELASGDAHTEVGRWGQYTFERLLDVNPEDVEATVCVRGVVYQDGNIEKF